MKKPFPRFPLIFALLTLFLLPAFLPLLRWGALPCTHDDPLHYYRMTAMRAAFRHGWTFSRWLPNLALGYGYPFFNFREPLPYLAGAGLYALGVPLPLLLGAMYIACLLVSAWGAYALARELFDARAAWIAAVAYGLGPYLLIDALRRGNMPESVALALIPWLLWSFRRLIARGGRRYFALSIALLVSLFLSHNISSLLLAPFLGGYVMLLAWLHRERRTWPWAFAAVAFVVLLTAWFWFPALTEQGTVQLHLSRTTRNNDFRYNFATLGEIFFHFPPPHDPDFLNPPMRLPLGLIQWILALIGLASLFRRDVPTERRALGIFFALAAAGYLWMSTASSQWLWEIIPQISFVQFPWRLVGRALLPVTLLASAAFAPDASPRPRRDEWPWLLTLVALALAAWPLTYPPKGMCETPLAPDMAEVYAFEQAGWMGVDPEGSYFPVWVEEYPTDLTLAQAWMRGEVPARLDVAALPEGAEVVSAEYAPLRATLELDAPEAFTARWLGFYYPGWRVRVEGARVEPQPEAVTGLLTFPVPAGRSTVEVVWGSTPSRTVVTAISAGAALALAAILAWPKMRPEVFVSETGVASSETGVESGVWLPGLLAVAVGLLAIRLLLVERVPNPVYRSRLELGLPEVTAALHQPFEGGLTLLGSSIEARAFPADDELLVELLWAAHTIPTREYHAVPLLLGRDGQTWSYPGTARPRGYEPTPPTTMWLPDQYAYDPHLVIPLPGTPPGVYDVVVSLFDRETLAPASPLGADGAPLGPHLSLATVQVNRPAEPFSLAQLGVPADAEPATCGVLSLWSMATDRAQAVPGDVVAVRWVWEALAVPSEMTATLRLRDADGATLRAWHLPPAAEWWPTSRWEPGDRWIGRHVLRLPGGLESGAYRLETTLPGCDAPLSAIALDVVAPERGWDVPADLRPADATFGDAIRLAGYDVAPQTALPGETVRVRLAWQARAEMDAAYRVFLHLVAADGALVAQDDGEPAAWSRPTPGWAVGEVVAETRSLAIPSDAPPGEYRLRVGWYLPGDARLLTAEGADVFELGALSVE